MPFLPSIAMSICYECQQRQGIYFKRPLQVGIKGLFLLGEVMAFHWTR